LNMLRRCQLPLAERESSQLSEQEGQASPQEVPPPMTFRAAFDAKCRTEQSFRDPWASLPTFEFMREPTEADLILNQAMPRTPKREITDEPDPVAMGMRRPTSRGRPSGCAAKLPTQPSSRCSTRSSSRRSRAGSREPSSNNSSQQTAQPPASLGGLRRVTWVSLEPHMGVMQVYPRIVADRIESAYCNRRSNVALAGLGGPFEDAVIDLHSGSLEHPRQRKVNGASLDVRRIEVSAEISEVTLHVIWDGGWRISDCEVQGFSEERHISLSESNSYVARKYMLPPMPKRRS